MIPAAQWAVIPVASSNGSTVEWIDESGVIISRGCHLLAGVTPFVAKRIASLPTPSWRELAGRTKLGRRLLRENYYNVRLLGDGSLFVTFDRRLAFIRNGGIEPIDTGAPSFRVLRNGCAEGQSGTVFFGAYTANTTRGPISIFGVQSVDGLARPVWTFKAGEVRHVHGVYADPYDGSIWITTGDIGKECRILRTADEFRTLETVGAGDESWRTVSLQFSADAIWYGTDAEYQRNHIVRLDRRTGEREMLRDIGGTVFYSTHAAGRHFFSVTTERCVGNPEGVAALWSVGDNGCELVHTARADRWAGNYFQYGQYLFPSIQSSFSPPAVWFSCMGLEGCDGMTFQARRL